MGEVTPSEWGEFGKNGDLKGSVFQPAIEKFYMTDTISRASITMAECTATVNENSHLEAITDA